ncbi:MAG: DNA polymerase/3'-5' exonuclease PolX [Sphingomonadales bacterium]
MTQRLQPTPSPAAPAGATAFFHNAEIAAAFDAIADMLEIGNANPFRVRAYRNASRVVTGLPAEAAAMIAKGEPLTDLPGIGEDLAHKIEDLARTGTTPLLDQLRRSMPPALIELLQLPSVGPKRVKALHDQLGVETIAQLHRALKDGRVAELRGFGPKTASRLLQAIEAQIRTPKRMKRAIAAQYAEPLAAYLRSIAGVHAAEIAGSYRRARDTVGDLDIVVTAMRTGETIEAFTHYPELDRIVASGTTRATGILRCGLQVDIRVVRPESYGSALVYFTGSKAHNIAIRRIARSLGLKISEYGVFRGRQRVAGKDEQGVYASIGLPLIPPELREDQGEINAAREGNLPDLIDVPDLRGDLHVHTTATDGRNSLAEMASAAKARGFDYIAVTEHSRRVTVAHGLNPARLRAQIAEIDAFNRRQSGFTILKGIEVDIDADGKLDLPEGVLAELDLVVAAVHSKFELSRADQTERILRALDNPLVTILAHPSGRLIGEREPYDVDMERILRKAKARGCFVELNAHPDRLDLLDTQCRMAKSMGVLVSINSDAHSTADFDNLRFGVGQARRGWLERGDVVNTRPLPELRRLIARTRGTSSVTLPKA